MIDNNIRTRLAMGLAAIGVNMKQASLAAGLSHAYCRDVIKRGRGKYENLEHVASSNGLSWQWLRTGQGNMIAQAAPHAADRSETIAIDPRALTSAMQVAFSLLGVTQPQAKTLTDIVLSKAEVPRTQPGVSVTSALRTVIDPDAK